MVRLRGRWKVLSLPECGHVESYLKNLPTLLSLLLVQWVKWFSVIFLSSVFHFKAAGKSNYYNYYYYYFLLLVLLLLFCLITDMVLEGVGTWWLGKYVQLFSSPSCVLCCPKEIVLVWFTSCWLSYQCYHQWHRPPPSRTIMVWLFICYSLLSCWNISKCTLTKDILKQTKLFSLNFNINSQKNNEKMFPFYMSVSLSVCVFVCSLFNVLKTGWQKTQEYMLQ